MSEPTRSGAGSIEPCLATLDQLPRPVLVIGEDGVLVHANRAWVTQVARAAPGGKPWAWTSIIVDEDRDFVRAKLADAVAGDGCSEVEFRVRAADGGVRVLEACSGRMDGACGAGRPIVVLATDVTVRHRAEERLAFMAGHDPLTGLANRRTFEEALDRAVSRAERGQPSSLLMLDMDHLKSYNDTHGHLEGDQALVNFAMLLRKHVRAGDMLARLGGDEFGVLLEGTGLAEANEIAERMRRAAAEEEFVAFARECELGVSAGLVSVEPSVVSRAILDRADVALYAAKASGRNRIVRWDRSLGGSATTDRTAARVREGFRDGHYSLVFQPIVRLADGSVSYYEALARLTMPDGDTLLPGEFMPVVERLGLMPRLTMILLDIVLGHLAEHPGVSLSLNLSASDLADEPLLAEVKQLVLGNGESSGRLVFEIAENVLVSNLAACRLWMGELQSLGVRFVLDDFGTGAGVYLPVSEVPVEQVKLSSAVIEALSRGPKAVAFVEALRELVESQGRSVVAACVETTELLDGVRSAGFSYCQGFRVGLPDADLSALVERDASLARAR